MSLMAVKRYLITLAISMAIYFTPEYCCEAAMLYMVGGSVGGALQELFQIIGTKPSKYHIISVWVVLLVGVVITHYKVKGAPLKYILLVIIAAMLYVVDFIPLYNVVDILTRYVNMVIRILSKSLILSLIIYCERGQRMRETASVGATPS